MPKQPVIALTGGPGGGKSALIDELQNDPDWAGHFVALPEAIQAALFTRISPREPLFQRVMVNLQIALEEGLKSSLDPDDPRLLICHRGSLDPSAYWLQRGWPQEEFYRFTGLTREDHLKRYTAVIHLVTAADGALDHYRRWPDAHRPEELEEAIKLDRWLQEAWSGHPNYYRLGNDGCDWETKARRAREILAKVLKIGVRGNGLG